MKKKVGLFTTITLGFLTAFGPFVTDFYLPVMPDMAKFFRTTPALVSLSLTTGMIGLAAGQVLIGPLSDKFGRKIPLVASLVIFSLASIGCAMTTDVMVFNALRVLQGLGGAGGIVISKSIATDLFTGRALQSFMAVLGTINGIAPVFAPIIGGGVASFTSWQGVFNVLLAIGVVLLVCSCCLRESLAKERRSRKNIVSVYGNLFKVFRNRMFTFSTVCMMFTFFTFFAYIASSPFILQQIYGLSPLQFSLCFGVNATMIGIGSIVCTRFRHQNTALKYGSINFVVSAALVCACLMGRFPLVLLMMSYIYLLICFGIMQPSLTAIALDTERDNAGSASAVFGAAGFLAGSISSPLVPLGNIVTTSSLIILFGSIFCTFSGIILANTVKRIEMSR